MLKYIHITKAEALGAIANEVREASCVALDLETTGFSPHACKPRLCSLNTGQGVYVIDLFQTGGLGPVGEALHNPGAEPSGRGRPVVIGQNLTFDQAFLLFHYGIELWPVFDTFRASGVLHNGRNLRHDLYALYARELGREPEAPDLGASDWSKPNLTQEQILYSAEDVTWLPPLRDALKPKLIQAGLAKIAQIEFGAILPEAAIKIAGFPIDISMWLDLAERTRVEADKLRDELVRELPNPSRQLGLFGFDPRFNLDSPKQLVSSLNELGLPITSTGEEVLTMWSEKYPVLDKLLKWRGLNTKAKSFGKKWVGHVDKISGRLHPGYYPLLAAGRYACTKPGLGQVPREKEYRACFRAPAGKKFVIADYSGIEMRLAADISGDPALLRVFNEGIDPHRHTAAILLRKPENEITKNERQMAKPVNFGFLYGLGAEKFVVYAKSNYGINLTLQQSEQFRERYFEEYAGLKEWHASTLSEGKHHRLSRTPLGRLRYMDSQAHNEYLNHPVQGAGADGLKMALREVYLRFKRFGGAARMVHHVHDEIITEVVDDPDLAKEVATTQCEAMRDAMKRTLPRVAVEVEPSTGATWADK